MPLRAASYFLLSEGRPLRLFRSRALQALLALGCCLTGQLATAQDAHRLDSLQQVLAAHPADTMGVHTLISGFATEYYLSDPDKAIAYCEQARTLSEQIKFEAGLGNALGWLAYLHEQQGEIEKALTYNFEALKTFRHLGNRKQTSILLNNIAAIYKDQGKIAEALQYHAQSLQLKKELHDQEGMATSYNNIGLIHANQGNVKEALRYYFRSLKLEEARGSQDGIATAWHNIATVYRDQGEFVQSLKYFRQTLAVREQLKDKYNVANTLNSMGLVYEQQGQLTQARAAYERALQLREELKDKQGQAHSLKNLGGLLEKQGQPAEALTYYRQSLQRFEELGDKWGRVLVLNKLSALDLQQGLPAEAAQYAGQALALARELGYPAEMRDAAAVLEKVYRGQGQWQQALQMKDLYMLMRDSVQNMENRKVSLQQQFQYEFDKKEAVLRAEQEKKDALAREELARHRLERNSLVAGALLLLIFLALLFHRFRYVSRTKKIIQHERDRSDNLLLNILPAETAEELKQYGEAQAHQYDLVTVLFADIKNFTRLAETLSPREVVSTLHEYFQAFDEITVKHGLEKIKTIGDAYLCAGGLSSTETADPKKVVQAALDMQQVAQRLRAQREQLHQPWFELRMGIHTGPVVAGVVGIKKFAYDIWGDTVNTAARMEQSSEAGRINLSGTTYELVREHFRCSFRGRIDAKNKGELEMYFVEAEEKSPAAALAAPAAAHAAF